MWIMVHLQAPKLFQELWWICLNVVKRNCFGNVIFLKKNYKLFIFKRAKYTLPLYFNKCALYVFTPYVLKTCISTPCIFSNIHFDPFVKFSVNTLHWWSCALHMTNLLIKLPFPFNPNLTLTDPLDPQPQKNPESNSNSNLWTPMILGDFPRMSSRRFESCQPLHSSSSTSFFFPDLRDFARLGEKSEARRSRFNTLQVWKVFFFFLINLVPYLWMLLWLGWSALFLSYKCVKCFLFLEFKV